MFMFDKKRILAIAHKAVIDRGYVIYDDFEDYLRELICSNVISPITGFRLFEIKGILLDESNNYTNRYVYKRVGVRARFYPMK
ncbi:MAG: hypothetical protein PHR43_05330 [Dehalococcoidales bacterium]|nr:hypothetical protein [Dehalococcoidales bacterium]